MSLAVSLTSGFRVNEQEMVLKNTIFTGTNIQQKMIHESLRQISTRQI
jgi:hypothetical protein